MSRLGPKRRVAAGMGLAEVGPALVAARRRACRRVSFRCLSSCLEYSTARSDARGSAVTLTIRADDTRTVRDLIDRMAAAQPHVAYLINPETNNTLTFGDLHHQSRR